MIDFYSHRITDNELRDIRRSLGRSDNRVIKSTLNRHCSRIAVNAVLMNGGGGGFGGHDEGSEDDGGGSDDDGEPEPAKAKRKKGYVKAKADGQSAVNNAPNPNAKSIKDISEIPEVAAYLTRIGAEVRSMLTAVVYENVGKYRSDIAVIKFDKKTGEVTAPKGYEPDEVQISLIKSVWSNYAFPTLKLVEHLILPPELKGKKDEDLFVFRDLDNRVVMIQLRVEGDNGKRYVPWTYWSDDVWRPMEPEGKLPLWGLDKVKGNSTVFIHEGAKAARSVREMIEQKTPEAKARFRAHPWAQELSNAAHVGWIGGALAPHRTDWKPLQDAGLKHIYIVADNDQAGISAVPKISFHMKTKTECIRFTNEFPSSFDLGDDFPPEMFVEKAGGKFYTGPSFASVKRTATWATDTIYPKVGKPFHVLRKSFSESWAYVREADVFVDKLNPMNNMIAEKIFNNVTAPFTESKNLARLVIEEYASHEHKLCYRPDAGDKRIIVDDGVASLNLYQPGSIKSAPGDITPFFDYMKHLFPNAEDRNSVFRWVATIIGRPKVRMGFALLLISKRQGVGKTTLAEKILVPILGRHNCSFPSADTIVRSQFNGFLAQKRLVVCNEIYEGHSWKATQRVKSLITDKEVDVNVKYMKEYTIDNWIHFFACSNSLRALKLEDDDRRWLVPLVTEELWPKEKWDELNNWLSCGGLGHIKYWAEKHKASFYYKNNDLPRLSERKKEIIDESRDDAQAVAVDIGKALTEENKPCYIVAGELKSRVEMVLKENLNSRNSNFSPKWLAEQIMGSCDTLWKFDRLWLDGDRASPIVNAKLKDLLVNEGLATVVGGQTRKLAPLLYDGKIDPRFGELMKGKKMNEDKYPKSIM